MTKRELARTLAERMAEIRTCEAVDVERLTEKLMKGMTQREIESALRSHARRASAGK